MCLICHARKAKSLSKLVSSAVSRSSQGCTCSMVAVEGKGANYAAVRAYSAVPQPADTSLPNRIEGYALHPSTLNPNILKAQYAVRGELYNKAQELAAEGREIIYTNGTCCRDVGGFKKNLQPYSPLSPAHHAPNHHLSLFPLQLATLSSSARSQSPSTVKCSPSSQPLSSSTTPLSTKCSPKTPSHAQRR